MMSPKLRNITAITLLILSGGAALSIYVDNQQKIAKAEEDARKRSRVKLGQIDPTQAPVDPQKPQLVEEVDRNYAPLQLPREVTQIVSVTAPAPEPAPAVAVRPVEAPPSVPRKEQKKKQALTPLVLAYEPERPLLPEPQAPVKFAPYGTMIKCKLVTTVDSSSLDTPVMAMVTDELWHNGRLIIPAGTEIHGWAKKGRERDRVEVKGTWRLVWHDGREYTFTGVALDREYDQGVDGFGITDGSAGLKGRVIKTDEYQELKLLAATMLAGVSRGSQTRTFGPLGTVTIEGSLRNGLLEGASAVGDQYAEWLYEQIKKDGYFVRIAAGKEFYVYATQTLEPDLASVANLAQNTPGETSFDRAREELAQAREAGLERKKTPAQRLVEAQQAIAEERERLTTERQTELLREREERIESIRMLREQLNQEKTSK